MAAASNSAQGNYSFFAHGDANTSSDSLSRLDDSHPQKQKRRRTSPRDHAILEAAYQRNSKPDKHERAEIVRQVELGEKEVQIWFQNRRQNDRRKSKPLQPHELLAHFRNGMPVQAVHQPGFRDDDRSHPSDVGQGPAVDGPRPLSRSSSIHELLNPPPSAELNNLRNENVHAAFSVESLPTPPSSFENAQKLDKTVAPNTFTKDQTTAVPAKSVHSRKRSHEVMAEGPVSQTSNPPADETRALEQPKLLARSSSFVRLAMTVDGAVKVRTNNEPTPSPPKQRTLTPTVPARKRESLGRSHSAVESGFGFKDINPPVRKFGDSGLGRSRDARTWEFYCDRDSGDALTTQAEAERSGSAIGAINLIRSRSQRNRISALSPNPTKQNVHRVRKEEHGVKPKLVRARSSLARLQNRSNVVDSSEFHTKRARHERSPSGDSDKENWAPGTRISDHAMRRTLPSAPRGSILQESDFPAARDPASDIVVHEQENRTAMAGKEKTKGDDLDCVQGLLSLSQES